MVSENLSIKIAVCGPGADSLLNQLPGKNFGKEHKMTVGAEFSTYQQNIEGNTVNFQMWNIAGHYTFQSVRSKFFKGVLGGLILFDITKPQSFRNVTRWIEELWRNSQRGIVPVIIVGINADLRDENSVKSETGKSYVSKLSEKTREKGFDVPYVELYSDPKENLQKLVDHFVIFVDFAKKVFS